MICDGCNKEIIGKPLVSQDHRLGGIFTTRYCSMECIDKWLDSHYEKEYTPVEAPTGRVAELCAAMGLMEEYQFKRVFIYLQMMHEWKIYYNFILRNVRCKEYEIVKLPDDFNQWITDLSEDEMIGLYNLVGGIKGRRNASESNVDE